MDLMDSSALAMALPTLSKAFHSDPFDLKLALMAYLVTVALIVPASGWMSGRFGAKKTFLAAIIVFQFGSLCCALSNSLEQLVIARILQGAGGAMMTPVARNIIVATSSKAGLMRALAWFTLPAILGPMCGPVLAGIVLEYGSWRGIFLLNLPVGLVGLWIVASKVPEIPRLDVGAFDWIGFFQIGFAIVTAMTLINTSGLTGEPPAVRIGFLAVAILAGWIYYRHSALPDPIVNLRLLGRATLTSSLVASWMQRLALGATPFLLPLELQIGMHMSPLKASQVMTAMAIGSLAARFVMPSIMKRLSYRNAGILLAGGAAIMSAGPACFYMGMPIAVMMIIMALSNLMRGLFFILSQTLAYADVEHKEVGHASVLFTISQQLSYGLGVSAGAWLLKINAHSVHLSLDDFRMPFLVIAAGAFTSVFAFLPLPKNAGANLRDKPVKMKQAEG